ncbi:RNA polymerase sigma factor [Jejuia spongiicola]|uniref:RNA polymerase sigma factor n=1 Tax=Jejuia spongiicola TaxID=2942207 RepID=A0ABT0QDN7_9FLAO|nr:MULTISPECIES: RNA polymerase sigma factor [Flavobacteriaceae]MCL6295092.1 RNA polymerase sigma factor [Jejuia spongiicola]PIA77643.1 RNA polymerase subunit sigma-24 [Gaetbulibacter sp. 4G1]
METNILYTHKELVEQSKLGDRNSQYKLYELYVDAMYNVSLRMVRIKEDAEDIVQDSFVEAFNKLDSFKYESTFGSWLKRIIINKSINHLKKRKILATPIEDQMYRIKAEENEEEAPQMEIKKVIKGIRLLPAGYQQIINLYLIEGYDHIEIGEILNISSSTSKSQYHRAKKKLIEIVKTL